MSLLDNLNAINNCKEGIKNALINKGVDMTNVSFSDYAKKINELQLESGDEPSAPTPSVDYIYSNGYVEGGTPDIMTYVPYEITELDSDNKFVIELFAPVELMGWTDICPDIVFGVDVPKKFELLDIEVFDSSSNKYIAHGFKKNIRYETIVRDGVTYDSYLRNASGYYESSDVMGDPSAPAYKYRITIKLR
jgi:hypothetical protein